MKTADFDFELPLELIAQHPPKERDASRLLVLRRESDSLEHSQFSKVVDFFKPGDRLVLNNVKVIPARLHCVKTSGAQIELLCSNQLPDGSWEALARGRRRLAQGLRLQIRNDSHRGIRVLKLLNNGGIQICAEDEHGNVINLSQVLEQFGEIPLPPYINRLVEPSDTDRYQTVYASEGAAVAAPTAGLHFTPELLQRLKEAGVGITYVTLNVGIGTFRPVSVDDPATHPIHSESFSLTPQSALEINQTRQNGGRIFAVGTTVVRVLEHCALGNRHVLATSGATNILILPGYQFKIVDGLITNFHLPKSSLIMLVSALAGREFVLSAYREAVEMKYRFFSYGDAMLLL